MSRLWCFFFFKLAFVLKQQNWQEHFSVFKKVPAFSTEDTEERRRKRKKITCVNGAEKKTKTKTRRTKYKKRKQKNTLFSFHIKSDEKYTKIENNYSRRHGCYGSNGREGCSFFFSLLFWFFVSPVIWQPDTVVFWGCLRRPPPGGAPRRPPPRLWCNPRSQCCRPWAVDGPPPAPPNHLRRYG